MRGIVKAGLFCCLLLAAGASRGADELPPTWPDSKGFTPGQEVKFRLPFFAGLYTYPNNEPMYHVLRLPAGYDPARQYPLVIRYQPQNGAPGTGPFERLADRGAIVLGVSYVLSKPFSDKGPFCSITSAEHWDAACARWVMSNFSVDRTRVFVGGFSGGGWAASEQGMLEPMRRVSTHFMTLGAGIRGSPRPQLFKGCPVIVMAGTSDFNHGPATSAASQFRSSGLNVTFYEEPGVGHEVGPRMHEKLLEWWDRFDPARYADEWIKQAGALEAKRDKLGACELYAKVATLGPSDPRGKVARERLVALEGKALELYEAAYGLLRARDYVKATKAFAAAYREATRAGAPRIAKLAVEGSDEVNEWIFGEEAMAMEETFFTGRVFESWLLASDGAARFAAIQSVKAWAGLFRTESHKLTAEARAAASRDPARARAQQKLAGARSAVWSGKYDQARKALDELASGRAGEPEAVDARMLMERIDRLTTAEAQ